METENGFSLIELLVAIAFFIFISFIAIPSYQNFILQKNADLASRQLMTAIKYARKSAIYNNKTVTLCASKSKKKCDGDFDDGFIVFIDNNKIGQYQTGDQLLRVYDNLFTGSLSWNRKRKYIQFSSLGNLLSQNGTFTYHSKNNDPKYTKKIIISKTGRVRLY